MIDVGLSPLQRAFREGSDDPVKALQRALAAADRAKDDKAILWRVPQAHAEAEASRARFVSGHPLSGLDGIPVAVKDCYDVAGLPSTNGTKFLTEPAAHDAVAVQRLRAAGAVVFAKTNMHEFGIQPTGVNPHWGTPVNPWDPARIPGGSSSGSAVAVASGIAAVALGSDAGGSIRVPAASTGLVGLKATFGAVPIDGVAGLTLDLDHAGPLAWTVSDAADVFEVIAARAIDRSAAVARPALVADLFEGADEAVAKAVRAAAREVFGELPEVAAPLCAWATAVEFVIVGTDAQKTCAPHLREHAADIAPDTRIILRLGAGLPASDRSRADAVRFGMRRELDELLQSHDVLIGPALGSLPPTLHPRARAYGELDTGRIARLAAVTFVTNLTGHPSCVVPCVRDGLPIGMQIIGRHGDESRVLAAAASVERAFGPRKPPRWYGA
ncbi:MAG TPA: amidase [Myxococcales bacterium]|nr:amidase [Myxococcales bacterium]